MESRERPKQRWEDETEKHLQSIGEFINESIQKKGRDRYDGTSEFHFSGGWSDSATISRIEGYYEGDNLSKLKVSTEEGHEVFIQGRALEDYLSVIGK